jgi:hypothetical protein
MTNSVIVQADSVIVLTDTIIVQTKTTVVLRASRAALRLAEEELCSWMEARGMRDMLHGGVLSYTKKTASQKCEAVLGRARN